MLEADHSASATLLEADVRLGASMPGRSRHASAKQPDAQGALLAEAERRLFGPIGTAPPRLPSADRPASDAVSDAGRDIEVHVTIGRLELVSPPPVVATTPRPRRPPRLSLTAYLDRGRAGWR